MKTFVLLGASVVALFTAGHYVLAPAALLWVESTGWLAESPQSTFKVWSPVAIVALIVLCNLTGPTVHITRQSAILAAGIYIWMLAFFCLPPLMGVAPIVYVGQIVIPVLALFGWVLTGKAHANA